MSVGGPYLPNPHLPFTIEQAEMKALTPEIAAAANAGKLPNFNSPSKHAAARANKKHPKRRNRRKP